MLNVWLCARYKFSYYYYILLLLSLDVLVISSLLCAVVLNILTMILTQYLLIHSRGHIVTEGDRRPDSATGNHRAAPKIDYCIISHLNIPTASSYCANTSITVPKLTNCFIERMSYKHYYWYLLYTVFHWLHCVFKKNLTNLYTLCNFVKS